MGYALAKYSSIYKVKIYLNKKYQENRNEKGDKYKVLTINILSVSQVSPETTDALSMKPREIISSTCLSYVCLIPF